MLRHMVRPYAGAMGHSHGHSPSHRRLVMVLALTVVVMVVEAAVAWVSGSLALLADAGHRLDAVEPGAAGERGQGEVPAQEPDQGGRDAEQRRLGRLELDEPADDRGHGDDLAHPDAAEARMLRIVGGRCSDGVALGRAAGLSAPALPAVLTAGPDAGTEDH